MIIGHLKDKIAHNVIRNAYLVKMDLKIASNVDILVKFKTVSNAVKDKLQYQKSKYVRIVMKNA